MVRFELVEPFEDFAAQAEPCRIGIIEIHHLLPYLNRKPIIGDAVPWNLRDLQSHCSSKEYSTAEEQRDGQLPVFESMEVFCDRDVEVEGAGNGYVDHGAAGKSRYVYVGVRPQQRLQGFAPLLRLTEQFFEVLLLGRSVTAANGLNLNLNAQGDGMDRAGFGICDAHFERELWRGCVGSGRDVFDLEAKVRQANLRMPGRARQKMRQSFSRLRYRRKVRANGCE